jgi:hypothetical protein
LHRKCKPINGLGRKIVSMLHIFGGIVKFYLDAVGGVIINTCGWFKGQDYQMLVKVA